MIKSKNGPMSILWTKKSKDYASFLVPHPPFAVVSNNQ